MYFDVLAKNGTRRILVEADSGGLTSRRETPEQIGLTKRMYYSRLRELKSKGLIVKSGEEYILTEIGEAVLEVVMELNFIGLIYESKCIRCNPSDIFAEES